MLGSLGAACRGLDFLSSPLRARCTQAKVTVDKQSPFCSPVRGPVQSRPVMKHSGFLFPSGCLCHLTSVLSLCSDVYRVTLVFWDTPAAWGSSEHLRDLLVCTSYPSDHQKIQSHDKYSLFIKTCGFTQAALWIQLEYVPI